MLNAIPGVHCDMVSVETGYDKFDDLIQEDVVHLTTESVLKYHIVFTLSLTLNVKTELSILRAIKSNGIKLIDILCGNLFILLQEEFVFDVHHIMKNYKNDFIDEVWVLEMYEYAKPFLEMVYNKPVRVLSYVWGVDIIQKYLELNNIPTRKSSNNEKINICIYEANMSLHKNAFNPLLISESYFKKFWGRLNKVYVFCKDTIKNNGYYEHLSLCEKGKIEFNGRMIMPKTVDIINRSTGFKTIVLSHTLFNNLNFLHLELMHMGIQIVHNCEPFQNGLYYDTFDLHHAVSLLEKARIEEPNQDACTRILEGFSCENLKIQNDWSRNINNMIFPEDPVSLKGSDSAANTETRK